MKIILDTHISTMLSSPYQHEQYGEWEMSFEAATKVYNELNAMVDATSQALKVFPRGNMGLISDEVRATAEYQTAKNAYNSANAKARAFNQLYNKAFKKELAAARKAKMAMRVA